MYLTGVSWKGLFFCAVSLMVIPFADSLHAYPINYDLIRDSAAAEKSKLHLRLPEPEDTLSLFNLLLDSSDSVYLQIRHQFEEFRHNPDIFNSHHWNDEILKSAIPLISKIYEYGIKKKGFSFALALSTWTADPATPFEDKETILDALMVANRSEAQIIYSELKIDERDLLFGYWLNEMMNQTSPTKEMYQRTLEWRQIFELGPVVSQDYIGFLADLINDWHLATRAFEISPRKSTQEYFRHTGIHTRTNFRAPAITMLKKLLYTEQISPELSAQVSRIIKDAFEPQRISPLRRFCYQILTTIGIGL
ncbi:MAG: hypothetical protein JWQ35_872 [Bacteriovoracaceae bacterium]|nr:hypothetical protein [Bacteriovoracaceae bacterium]